MGPSRVSRLWQGPVPPALPMQEGEQANPGQGWMGAMVLGLRMLGGDGLGDGDGTHTLPSPAPAVTSCSPK